MFEQTTYYGMVFLALGLIFMVMVLSMSLCSLVFIWRYYALRSKLQKTIKSVVPSSALPLKWKALADLARHKAIEHFVFSPQLDEHEPIRVVKQRYRENLQRQNKLRKFVLLVLIPTLALLFLLAYCESLGIAKIRY